MLNEINRLELSTEVDSWLYKDNYFIYERQTQ